MVGQVNSTLFEHLFMELVYYTLDNSVGEDSAEPDHEIAFYKIERIGFTNGQRIIERYLGSTNLNLSIISCVQAMS